MLSIKVLEKFRSRDSIVVGLTTEISGGLCLDMFTVTVIESSVNGWLIPSTRS